MWLSPKWGALGEVDVEEAGRLCTPVSFTLPSSEVGIVPS